MEIVIGIIIIAFIIGLITRDKGDGLLDTLGSGCSSIIAILVIAFFVYLAYSKGMFK